MKDERLLINAELNVAEAMFDRLTRSRPRSVAWIRGFKAAADVANSTLKEMRKECSVETSDQQTQM